MEKVVVTRSSNTPRTYDRRGGGGEWVLRNSKHTTDLRPLGGGGGGARNSKTPRTYDRRADLWPAGLSQKGGQIRIRLDAALDAGQGYGKPDSPAWSRTNGRPISALC